MLSRNHFITAAEQVRDIKEGRWTHVAPDWADESRYDCKYALCDFTNYTRAVQTAEAYMLLFSAYNPRFDKDKFLSACGL